LAALARCPHARQGETGLNSNLEGTAMKALLLPLAACAVLAGCATYGDPYYGGYSHPAYTTGVVQTYPGYYGGAVYNTYPQQRTYRDRDRDGIPNRMDADRDNDGVPNQMDARPNNPRRY
jgi:uncharacterized protein YceK